MEPQRSLFPHSSKPREPHAPAQLHSATSVAAAEKIEGRGVISAQIGLILHRLLDAGALGKTDEELQRATGMTGDSERPRRVRAVELGLVADSGEVRATRSGRSAVVWKLTPRGIERARQIAGPEAA